MDKVSPWYAFVCASLQPTAHLSDVSRERAILLHALITGAFINVGRVIFDHYMHSVWAKLRGIGFPSLITTLCAWNGVTWVPNEEKAALMKPIDGALIAKFLGFVPPTKRSFATVGVGSSSLAPRAQNVHGHLDHMDRILEYHGE